MLADISIFVFPTDALTKAALENNARLSYRATLGS
jgi:hypothetical protein